MCNLSLHCWQLLDYLCIVGSRWCNILNQTKTECMTTLYVYSIHQSRHRSWVSRAIFLEVPRTGRHTPAVFAFRSTASSQTVGMHWRDLRTLFFSHLFSQNAEHLLNWNKHIHNRLQVSIQLCQRKRYNLTQWLLPLYGYWLSCISTFLTFSRRLSFALCMHFFYSSPMTLTFCSSMVSREGTMPFAHFCAKNTFSQVLVKYTRSWCHDSDTDLVPPLYNPISNSAMIYHIQLNSLNWIRPLNMH